MDSKNCSWEYRSRLFDRHQVQRRLAQSRLFREQLSADGGVEFARISLYSAEGLPTPEERLKEFLAKPK